MTTLAIFARVVYKQGSINYISIQYNYLNLPGKVTPNSKVMDYFYRADGVKIRKVFDTKTTDYLDGFQYENSTLKFFPTTEGYFNVETGKYVYNYTDHLGNIRLSYAKNGAGTEIIEESNYYPFGLKHEGYNVLLGNSAYKYKYNGKELQETGMYDYGARMYMSDIGRWPTMDGKGELYLSKSPYSYANNTPVNAIDPDGNLVIFINGQHGGSGGSSDYWRSPKPIGYMAINGSSQFAVYTRFDQAVMRQLNDNNSLYRDGALGGFTNTLFATGNVNISAANRINSGFAQGKKDAAEIIKNLARDSSTGEIVETIKIITHSMGGAYGNGYVKALKEYISTLPKDQQSQIKITLVADFDPFQAGSFKANSNTKTQQFMHEDNENIKGMGWLANEQEEGAEQVPPAQGDSSDHSILSFFKDISNMQEGTYKWNGSSWACTNCNH